MYLTNCCRLLRPFVKPVPPSLSLSLKIDRKLRDSLHRQTFQQSLHRMGSPCLRTPVVRLHVPMQLTALPRTTWTPQASALNDACSHICFSVRISHYQLRPSCRGWIVGWRRRLVQRWSARPVLLTRLMRQTAFARYCNPHVDANPSCTPESTVSSCSCIVRWSWHTCVL